MWAYVSALYWFMLTHLGPRSFCSLGGWPVSSFVFYTMVMPGFMWVLYACLYAALMLIAYAQIHDFVECFTLFLMLGF